VEVSWRREDDAVVAAIVPLVGWAVVVVASAAVMVLVDFVIFSVTTVTVTSYYRVCVCLSNSPDLVDDGQTNSVLLANLSGRQAPFRAEVCSF